MAGQMERFDWVARVAKLVLTIVLVLIGIALASTAAVGVIEYMHSGSRSALYQYGIGLVAELIAAGLAVVFYGLVVLLVASQQAAESAAGRLGQVETLLDDMAKSTRKLVDLACLSDQAKSLIYRDRELDAAREAVNEDLLQQDYKAAEALLASIEKSSAFGEEATRLREEIITARKATLEEKIDRNIQIIQGFIDRRDWSRALRESQRMLKMFPNNPKLAPLPQRVEDARTAHKRSLLQVYGEAVGKNDIDRSIELLKELDGYLTPQEGAALEESARGVFRAKLHSMGVQFAMRVNDSQWAEAVAIGEEIVRDYPNTRMAQEVRQKMDLLKSRSAAKRQAPKE